jgi:hypothetical protein
MLDLSLWLLLCDLVTLKHHWYMSSRFILFNECFILLKLFCGRILINSRIILL